MKTPTINKQLNEKLLQKRQQPNYDLVKELVYYVHKYLCNPELPIDLSFMYKFKNLKIQTYSWFSKFNNISIEETINLVNSDSGCCWYLVNQDRYLILYNDLIENPCHNRWTLAHEFGHYLLKHNEICDTAVLGRNSINLDEYKIYEKEANAFARELLAPLNVLCCIVDNSVTLTQIMEMCDLSYEASKNIINFANNGQLMGVSYFHESETTKLFEKFIKNCKCLNSCMRCKYTFTSLDAKFCPICGSNEIIKGDTKNKMNYISNFRIDTNSRLLECPICHNEEIVDGEFCKICGSYLINKCTNTVEDEWGNQLSGCGKLADANARFCIYCGAKTTFFNNGLLCDYKDYNQTQETINIVWKDILQNLKDEKKIMLYTNLINSTLEEFKQDTYTINLNSITPFGEVILCKKENIDILKEILGNKHGKTISLNIYNTKTEDYIYEEDTLPF